MKTPELPYFYFIPDYRFFDAVEMAPCQLVNELSEGWDVERIDDPKETDKIAFWSVYLHYITGGVDCVADFETREEAETLVALLEWQLEVFQAQLAATT